MGVYRLGFMDVGRFKEFCVKIHDFIGRKVARFRGPAGISNLLAAYRSTDPQEQHLVL